MSGPQRGMAGGLDFGFLKEEMVEIIDKPCDHGLILAFNDPLIAFLPIQKHDLVGKVYMVEEPPTAEYLAQHWYELLKPRVAQRSMGFAKLVAIKVNETPTCWAMYPATVITSEVLHSR